MMKNLRFLVLLMLAVASCKKSEPDIPSHTEASSKPSPPKPTPLKPPADPPSISAQEKTPPVTPLPQPEETANTLHKPGPKTKARSQGYPVALPVEGQPGFVKSPYNGKTVDVRDMPSGTLVQDPSFPAEERKYFRAP